jgi:hypothetical protein
MSNANVEAFTRFSPRFGHEETPCPPKQRDLTGSADDAIAARRKASDSPKNAWLAFWDRARQELERAHRGLVVRTSCSTQQRA